MIKEFIAKATNFLPQTSKQWLMGTFSQVLRGGTPIVESHSSRKPISVPQAFAGPAKRDFRRHKQRLGQNPSRPQPHFGFQSPFKPLDLTPARKRPFEVLVHGQGVLAAKEGHKTVEKKEPKSKGLKKKRAKAPQEAVEKAPPKGKKKGETASAAAKNDCKRAPVSLELADSVSRYRSKFRRKLRKLSVLVFEELNARNQTLDLFALEKVIGHKFTEPKILALVLIHLGSMKSEEGFNTLNLVENQGTQLALMWIGDSVLQFLITEQLIARYNTPDNYQLHEARVSLANRRNCAKQARKLGLENYALYGSALRSVSDNMLGEMFEALIGVIYLDGGMRAASSFFARQVDFPSELKALL